MLTPPADATPILPGTRRRILLLDPDAAFSMKLRFSLQREFGTDVEVEATTTTEEAIQFLQKGKFDLIVAEVFVDRGDPLMFMEEVAVLAPRTRLIVTSEFFFLADFEKTYANRLVLTCVRKPIQPDALAALVIRWLEGKVSAAENEELFDLVQLIRLERITCLLSLEGTREFKHVGGRVRFADGVIADQSCWTTTKRITLEQLMRYPALEFSVSRVAEPSPLAPLLDPTDLVQRSQKRTTRLLPQRIGLKPSEQNRF